SSTARGSPCTTGRWTVSRTEHADRDGSRGQDDDARPAAADDLPERRPTGLPVGHVVDLTPPAEVARQALNRAKAAARAKGLRPGQAPRGRTLAGPPRSGARPGGRDPQLLGDVVARLLRERDWVADVSVGG